MPVASILALPTVLGVQPVQSFPPSEPHARMEHDHVGKEGDLMDQRGWLCLHISARAGRVNVHGGGASGCAEDEACPLVPLAGEDATVA